MENNKIIIKSIYIKNFRSISLIEEMNIEGNLIPIVGLNGAGKSNILKSIDWFRNNVDYSNSDGELFNIYNQEDDKLTIVAFIFDINSLKPWSKQNRVNISKSLEISLDKLVEEFEVFGNRENIGKLEKFKEEILNNDVARIEKTQYFKEAPNYQFNIELPISEIKLTDEDKNEIISTWSEIIYKNIISEYLPNIRLLDTKETLKEFEDEESNEDISFSFKRMFSWTEFESKTEDKYKIISKILARTNTGYTFENLMSLNNANNSSQISMMNEKAGDDLLQMQKEFSQAITSNGFFRSINSDNEFNIFPQFQATKFVESDDGKQIQLDSAYRLVLFDTATYENGETKDFPVEDISFKNDGFIFALILFMEIDFLIEPNSILLIDEPANFLSTPSIKLLMENFKRISNNDDIKFIFTTHSSYTLEKNLINLDDIVIAKKGKNFSTNIYGFDKNKDIKYELEIISDEYNGPKKGRNLMLFNPETSKKYSNYLIKAKNQLQKDFVEFLNEYTEENIVPLYDVKLVKNNLSKFYGNNNHYLTTEVRELSKINDLIHNDDIIKIVGKYELTRGGAINNYNLENDENYKTDLIKLIFVKFNKDFASLKTELEVSSKLIDRKIKDLLK